METSVPPPGITPRQQLLVDALAIGTTSQRPLNKWGSPGKPPTTGWRPRIPDRPGGPAARNWPTGGRSGCRTGQICIDGPHRGITADEDVSYRRKLNSTLPSGCLARWGCSVGGNPPPDGRLNRRVVRLGFEPVHDPTEDLGIVGYLYG